MGPDYLLCITLRSDLGRASVPKLAIASASLGTAVLFTTAVEVEMHHFTGPQTFGTSCPSGGPLSLSHPCHKMNHISIFKLLLYSSSLILLKCPPGKQHELIYCSDNSAHPGKVRSATGSWGKLRHREPAGEPVNCSSKHLTSCWKRARTHHSTPSSLSSSFYFIL